MKGICIQAVEYTMQVKKPLGLFTSMQHELIQILNILAKHLLSEYFEAKAKPILTRQNLQVTFLITVI